MTTVPVSVRLKPAAAAWLGKEAARRGVRKTALIEELIDAARDSPSAYYAHAAAVQSWATATMVRVLVRHTFGREDADPLLRGIADMGDGLFAADPPAPSGVANPVQAGAALHRLMGALEE